MAKKVGDRDKRSPALQAVFLDELRKGATVSEAAAVAGVVIRTVYKWREADDDFKEEWAEAYREGADVFARAARKRAVNGTKRVIYFQGMPVGVERQYSDALLMFMLAARDPEKYCARVRAATIAEEAERRKKADSDNAAGLRKEAEEALAMLQDLVAAKAAKAGEEAAE